MLDGKAPLDVVLASGPGSDLGINLLGRVALWRGRVTVGRIDPMTVALHNNWPDRAPGKMTDLRLSVIALQNVTFNGLARFGFTPMKLKSHCGVAPQRSANIS